MKYIRTENGIYEVVDFDNECIIPSPIVKMNGRLTHCSNYKDYKQADTIEELCDEVVMIRKEENLHTTLRNYSIKDLHLLKDRQKHNFEIYGAIWTDKGLIYVAKMGSDGKLVLI